MTAGRRLPHWPHLWIVFVAGLVVATVVLIALATPGPWHAVLPTARVGLVAKPPADIAVFLDGKGSLGPKADMILWLHIGYERPTLAVVVVPPEVLVLGAGGSSSPESLSGLAEREGAAAGADALCRLLGVHVGGWLVVDRDALLGSLGASAVGAQLLGGGSAGLTEAAFGRQVSRLRALVVLAPRKGIPVHAFENYLLASGEVSTSLGLNGVASLGKALHDAAAADVRVVALPAHMVGGAWIIDPTGARSLVERLRGR
jgi:hypothetical protein